MTEENPALVFGLEAFRSEAPEDMCDLVAQAIDDIGPTLEDRAECEDQVWLAVLMLCWESELNRPSPANIRRQLRKVAALQEQLAEALAELPRPERYDVFALKSRLTNPSVTYHQFLEVNQEARMRACAKAASMEVGPGSRPLSSLAVRATRQAITLIEAWATKPRIAATGDGQLMRLTEKLVECAGETPRTVTAAVRAVLAERRPDAGK